MRIILSMAIVVITATLSLAQEGSWYIGGGVGFRSSDGDNEWKFSPEVGTWTSDKIQVGLVLGLSGNETSTDIAPLLYVRRWKSVGDKFSVFLGLYGQFTSRIPEQGDTQSGFGINLDAGVSYALAEKWGMVGRMGVVGYESFDGTGTFTFGVDGSQISIFNVGLYYTFKQ